MRRFRAYLIRTSGLFNRRSRDREMAAEMELHLQLHIEDNLRIGMTPAEARRQAVLKLGGIEAVKETYRDRGSLPSVESLFQDLRYAARNLRKNPGFTAIAILTLALGIGANTAIFSVVNALLLKPLPFRDSGRLMRLWPTQIASNTETSAHDFGVASYPEFRDWLAQSRTFQNIGAFRNLSFDITGGDHPERIHGMTVSAGLSSLLGFNPILGRDFREDESQPGKNHVVLLSEGTWRREFGGDPNVLGRTIKLSGENYSVVGVLPAAFGYSPYAQPPDVVTPLRPDPNRDHGFLYVVGRLKPGATISQAQAEFEIISRQLRRQYGERESGGVRIIPLRDALVRDVRMLLLVLLSAVGFVLLIACANVANLILARTAARRKELVVRATLGASRLRIARQLLTESALLGLAGGLGGLLIANAGLRALVTLFESAFATTTSGRITIDGAVLAFTLIVSLLTGFISGLIPAVGIFRSDVNETLKEGSRSVTSGKHRNRIRNLIVAAEMALALVLLTGAGLTIKSFVILANNDPGVRTHNMLAISFTLNSSRFKVQAQRSAFFDGIIHRLQGLPGVESATVAADIPLTRDEDSDTFSIEGKPDPAPNKKREARFNIVGPGYCNTLGIPLLKGRDFTESDGPKSAAVATINEAMARQFWPGEDPVGKRISNDDKTWFSIAGIVGNVRQRGLNSEPQPEIYISYLQDPFLWPSLNLIVRTTTEPEPFVATIEKVIWSVDRDQPITRIRTMDKILSQSTAQPRLTALLLGLFSVLALVLASIGIYGVISWSVTQRIHEIGVRAALGASRNDVYRLVLGQGLALALIGVAVGLAGALALTRLIATLLYNVGATDPTTFIGVALLLTAVALLASWLPARRATRVDPMVALRYE
ncbi:MAG TPA: ABC transporter permease [Bryobacteraceae bacterium]|nr:ABC transporter permease [Bryobacteraceae bacterium]